MERRQFLAAAGAAVLLPVPKALADDMTDPNTLPRQAPVHVGTVGLRTRDAEALAAYYRRVVGLTETGRAGNTIWLGTAGTPLLALTEAEGLSLAPQASAGLYHTAFLLPSRADLARWVGMASMDRLPVDGASDHLVSEAIYLTDPEGNGIEIYADRLQAGWDWTGGQVRMATEALNVPDLMAELGPVPLPWQGAPAGTMIGHVHLKVGDAEQGAAWWTGQMGLDRVRARRGAVFLSTGGYHHHVAVNEWQSRGAGRVAVGQTGLDFVELRRAETVAPQELEDPWGLKIRLT